MSLEYIIQQAIDTLVSGPMIHTRPVRYRDAAHAKRIHPLCAYHRDDSVRSVIHVMLRMVECSSPHGHTISPCYRSNNPIECKHNECPYVIGHSIYLWVAKLREVMRPGEDGGYGCSYKHEFVDTSEVEAVQEDESTGRVRKFARNLNRRAAIIRDCVFRYLDEAYEGIHVAKVGPVQAMDRLRGYYDTVLRPLIRANYLDIAPVCAMDLTAKKHGYVDLLKNADWIFEPPVSAEEDAAKQSSPPATVTIDDRFDDDYERFPPLESQLERAADGSLYRNDDDDM